MRSDSKDDYTNTAPPPEGGAGLFPVLLSLLLIAAPILLLTFPYFEQVSSWLAVAICLGVATIAHLSVSTRTLLAVPHIIILISLLQLVLAAWWSYYFPLRSNDIGSNIGNYLNYSIPFICALAAGMFIALIGLKSRSEGTIEATKGSQEEQQQINKVLNAFIFGGIALSIFIKIAPIPGFLHFICILLSSLRYVGGLGAILTKTPNLRYKITFLLFFEILLSTNSALFHHLLIFMASVFVAFLFHYRLGIIKTFSLVLIGIASLFVLEYSKIELREEIAEAEASDTGEINQLATWIKYLGQGSYKLVTFSFDEKLYSHISTRFNQGWIVNLVMQHVPDNEPYANGDTIKRAISSSFLPRFLAPDKYSAGGREYFIRFTGYTPSIKTSMNIALAGEFFANFGRNGAITFSLIYGFFLGLIIRGFYHLAKRHILWWAFLPYMFFWTYKAEEGFGEILNWMSKSAFVILALVLLIPTLRAQLWQRRPENTVTSNDINE